MTFDTTIQFEELPLVIGASQVTFFDGNVGLKEDPGYGFIVEGIELDGHNAKRFSDKTTTRLYAKHDDPFCRALFEKLSEAIYANADIKEQFNEALNEYMWEAA